MNGNESNLICQMDYGEEQNIKHANSPEDFLFH